jgi:hypothetical protein
LQPTGFLDPVPDHQSNNSGFFHGCLGNVV